MVAVMEDADRPFRPEGGDKSHQGARPFRKFEAIEQLEGQWQDGATRDLFLIQLLPELTDKVTSVLADNLRIDRLTILDGGDGEGLPNFVKNLTNSSVSMLEQLRNATGIDLADLADRGKGDKDPQVPKDLQ